MLGRMNKWMLTLAAALWWSPALAAGGGGLVLWYRQPAQQPMNESLPVGNGRIGGLIAGGVA